MAITADGAQAAQQHQITISSSWGPSYPQNRTRGFKNPSVLCYRNAVLTLLLHTPLLLNWIEEAHKNTHDCDPRNINLICALSHLVSFYWFTNGETQSHESCMELVWSRLRATSWSDVNVNGQQDAREFLEAFFKQLKQDAVAQRHWELQRLFQIRSNKHLDCKTCGTRAPLQPDQQFFLVASFPEVVNQSQSYEVAHAISHNLEESSVMWTCSSCGCSTDHSLCERIESLPEVLFIQVNRFGYKAKLLGNLKVEDQLVIPDALRDPNSLDKAEARYELYSIIFHKGPSVNTGHYVCAVKSIRNDWRLVDDGDVKDGLALDEILGRKKYNNQTYILAYRRLPLDGVPTRARNYTIKALAPSTLLFKRGSPAASPPLTSTIPRSREPANNGSPDVIMEESIHLRDGVEWKVTHNLMFPDGVDHLIELKPRARLQHAKVHLTFTSPATGEVLEGEVSIPLAPKKKSTTTTKTSITTIRRTRGRPPKSKKAPKPKRHKKKTLGTTAPQAGASNSNEDSVSVPAPDGGKQPPNTIVKKE